MSSLLYNQCISRLDDLESCDFSARKLTVCRPRALRACQGTAYGAYTRRLEPYVSTRLPSIDIGSIWYTSHVELNWAEVTDACRRDEAERGARSHGCGPGPGSVLEASHVGAGDGCDPRVRLIVLRLPDGRPFLSFGYAVENQFGKAIYTVASVHLSCPSQTWRTLQCACAVLASARTI